jgi:hypothetical protein
LQIGSTIWQDLGRVEREKDTRREGHSDSFTYARNSCAGDFLFELFRLLIHLMPDHRARSASDYRADDRAARRRPGRMPDHSSDRCTGTRPYHSAALLLTHASATGKHHRSGNDQRADYARGLFHFHSTVPWESVRPHNYKLGATH